MGVRAGVAVAALALAGLAACTGGDGGGRAGAGRATTTTLAPPTTTLALSTTTSTLAPGGDPTGAVTLHADGFVLPAGGSGLRMLARPTGQRVTVRRRGGGGVVTACPAIDVAGPAGPGGCAPLEDGHPLELAAWGVDLRAGAAGDATVDEVSLTYVPADHSITLVTPARAAGSCGTARPCLAAFSITPAHPGPFSLDGRGGGARPRLTLSNTGPNGSINTLVTVEGGGNLSIRATLDGASPASLAYREESADAIPAFTAEILWP
jgi:hypothetical protein